MASKRLRRGIFGIIFSIVVCFLGLMVPKAVASAEESSVIDVTQTTMLNGWSELGEQNMFYTTQLTVGEGVLSGVSIDYKTLPEAKYGYIAEYITLNGKTIAQINKTTDTSSYVYDLFPAEFDAKYRTAILLYKADGLSDKLEISIHKSYFSGLSGAIELGVKSGLFFKKDGSRYEITENITFRLQGDTWLRCTNMSDDVLLEGPSVVGLIEERVLVRIRFQEGILENLGIGFGVMDDHAYRYIADYITINQTTVNDINANVNASEYTYPDGTEECQKLPVLVVQNGDALDVKIHKDYLSGLGEHSGIMLSLRAGLTLSNLSVKRFYILEKTLDKTIREARYLLTVHGETTYSLPLMAGDQIVLTAPAKEHYDFLKWVDKDGNDGLAEMPTHDYELFSVYTPKVYTVTFLDENGTVVSTAEYTVENPHISIPNPPEKEGYKGYWSPYVLDFSDKVVTVVYVEIAVDPEDEPMDKPEDTPNDTPTDAPEDTPNETPEDVPTEKPEDIPTDNPGDTSTVEKVVVDVTKNLSLSGWTKEREIYKTELFLGAGVLSAFHIGYKTLEGDVYKYITNYVTLNGRTISEINAKTDVSDYAFTVFPSTLSDDYRLPIVIGQAESGLDVLCISVHERFLALENEYVEIGCLAGLLFENDTTRYELTENKVYHLYGETWLEKEDITAKVTLSGWMQSGLLNEGWVAKIDFGKDTFKSIGIGNGAINDQRYQYIAEAITINGKSVAKINRETDISEYVFPQELSGLYRVPVLISQDNDVLEIKIHKKYIEALGEKTEILIEIHKGLMFYNTATGKAHSIETDISFCVRETRFALVIDGDIMNPLLLSEGADIVLNARSKPHYTFLKWVDKDGNDALTKMPKCDYEVYSMYALNVYSVTFLDENGGVVATLSYTVENTDIVPPAVPEKDGYTGTWESFVLDGGDKSVAVVYTAIPNAPSETPDEPSETPDEPSETPDEPSETPDEPSETPDEPSETPDEPSETPDEPSDIPDEPSDIPDEPSDIPDEPSDIPDEPSGDSSQETGNSSSQENVDSSTEKPNGDNNTSSSLLLIGCRGAVGVLAPGMLALCGCMLFLRRKNG